MTCYMERSASDYQTVITERLQIMRSRKHFPLRGPQKPLHSTLLGRAQIKSHVAMYFSLVQLPSSKSDSSTELFWVHSIT
uniref:Uncharacterized protein n=1 Tax=Arundo donax TaxID=35708 RepID=A0A0A8Z3L3_ARUDO